MISDSLNIAALGLKTQQKAMDVVAHNIANVNTKGYSRQLADIVTISPDSRGGLSFGRGVEVGSIHRIIDPIINDAMLKNGSQQAFWNEVNSGLNTVENVFGSLQGTGLSAALNDFFLSWQQLANNPQDTSHKINLRAKSTTIVNNLSNMRQQLVDAQSAADARINDQIQQANRILDRLASLTIRINRQESGLQGAMGAANDLRDQHDQLVRDLAGIIPIQQVRDANGGLLIQTEGGDLLSQDGVVRHLARGSAAPGSFAPITMAASAKPIQSAGTGGAIGGLTELRDNRLGNYLQQLNSITANLIFAVNQIHASGSSGAAHAGFTAEQATNTALALDDAAQTAPFAAQIKSGSFKIHVYDSTGAATPAGGAVISVTAGTTKMSDIVTSLNAVAGVSASINAANMLSISATGSNKIALSDDTSNMLAAYEINSFFHGANAASLGLTTNIQSNAANINAGRVVPATSVIDLGDNASALAIMALQNKSLSIDSTPSASLHGRTTSLSTLYGADAAFASQQKQYRMAEAESLNSQRQAVSGVNIDEELITMIEFQRAYEASAKVISTTNTMLDSLMVLLR